MVTEGDRIQRDNKTYILFSRRFGRIKNYYLFTPDECKRADKRFRKYYKYE